MHEDLEREDLQDDSGERAHQKRATTMNVSRKAPIATGCEKSSFACAGMTRLMAICARQKPMTMSENEAVEQ